jgi:hypothetical protein
MRFLDREQIQRLNFGPRSASACKRRLTLLYHGEFVDRLPVPSPNPGGSPRALYCLDRGGAELLALHEGTSLRKIDWRHQDNDKEAFFLAHLRDSNDVWIGVRESCRRRGWSFSWTNERELRRTLTRKRLPRGDDLLVIPDGRVVVDDGAAEYAFALELDRGTVDEKRIREKVRGYGRWLTSGDYGQRYGEDTLRVIFVVSGPRPRERAERLKRWCEGEGGRSLFWFATKEVVDRADLLVDAIWSVAGTTNSQALMRQTTTSVHGTLPVLH